MGRESQGAGFGLQFSKVVSNLAVRSRSTLPAIYCRDISRITNCTDSHLSEAGKAEAIRHARPYQGMADFDVDIYEGPANNSTRVRASLYAT